MLLENISLESETVKLIPLDRGHSDQLAAAASDGNLWETWYTSVPNKDSIEGYIEQALAEAEQGIVLPFSVLEKSSNRIIGTTRFYDVDPRHKRLALGYTWYAKSYQRTSVNSECKLLLLRHAFEVLGCISVVFYTHWHNLRSREAILRLGARQDGVLRNHMIMDNGTYRDTVVFSITNYDWPTVKVGLEEKIAALR